MNIHNHDSNQNNYRHISIYLKYNSSYMEFIRFPSTWLSHSSCLFIVSSPLDQNKKLSQIFIKSIFFQIIFWSLFPLLQTWAKYSLSCDRRRRIKCHFSLICPCIHHPMLPCQNDFPDKFIWIQSITCSRMHNGWLTVHFIQLEPFVLTSQVLHIIPVIFSWIWGKNGMLISSLSLQLLVLSHSRWLSSSLKGGMLQSMTFLLNTEFNRRHFQYWI